ncbi:hypothetical protein EO95_00400 [Methanosarcina sp. 1.H.T.1A.1]|nr:hypothetical protein EO95_00400 [Methanosarcina sp. 1.H.T.1A.1]
MSHILKRKITFQVIKEIIANLWNWANFLDEETSIYKNPSKELDVNKNISTGEHRRARKSLFRYVLYSVFSVLSVILIKSVFSKKRILVFLVYNYRIDFTNRSARNSFSWPMAEKIH